MSTHSNPLTPRNLCHPLPVPLHLQAYHFLEDFSIRRYPSRGALYGRFLDCNLWNPFLFFLSVINVGFYNFFLTFNGRFYQIVVNLRLN